MRVKKVTIKDVARYADVSITTVSQILNGKEAKFSPKTVRKVQEAKQTLGYEPDYTARRMVMHSSKTIGVLVPDITNPFFNELVRGIENVMYQEGFITILANADSDQSKEDDYLTKLSHRGVDGFVIASSAISNVALKKDLVEQGNPLIVLDQKNGEGLSDAVLTDDFSGGRQAGLHLIELGHQVVAVVLPKDAPSNINDRLNGFRSIYSDVQLRIIHTELSREGGKAAVKDILKTNATAIFAVSDEIALGIYLGLTKAHKKIPDDYSVIGYDNIEMGEYVTPGLTTVAQPIFELGQTTAKMLLSRIDDPEKPLERKTLPVKIKLRNSTARLN